jgi:transcriptional regulator with XRE-family HTH domain
MFLHAAIINSLCMTVNNIFLMAGAAKPAAVRRTMTFRDRLRKAITASGRSQAAIARAAGISPQRLNNYLARDSMPDMTVIDRLAAAIGCDAEELVRGGESLRTALEAILARVLELDGQNPARASALAKVTVEALKIQRGLPDEGDIDLRSRLAASAAWQIRGVPARPQ